MTEVTRLSGEWRTTAAIVLTLYADGSLVVACGCGHIRHDNFSSRSVKQFAVLETALCSPPAFSTGPSHVEFVELVGLFSARRVSLLITLDAQNSCTDTSALSVHMHVQEVVVY